MQIKSKVFKDEKELGRKYTCEGDDINPPLKFIEVPSKTRSLVLIVDDPDAPDGVFTHWLVWNMDVDRAGIDEGETPTEAVVGINDMGNIGYGGPCPPKGHGEHRYFFKLFALEKKIGLESGATKKELKVSIDGLVLKQSEIIGKYERV